MLGQFEGSELDQRELLRKRVRGDPPISAGPSSRPVLAPVHWRTECQKFGWPSPQPSTTDLYQSTANQSTAFGRRIAACAYQSPRGLSTRSGEQKSKNKLWMKKLLKTELNVNERIPRPPVTPLTHTHSSLSILTIDSQPFACAPTLIVWFIRPIWSISLLSTHPPPIGSPENRELQSFEIFCKGSELAVDCPPWATRHKPELRLSRCIVDFGFDSIRCYFSIVKSAANSSPPNCCWTVRNGSEETERKSEKQEWQGV